MRKPYFQVSNIKQFDTHARWDDCMTCSGYWAIADRDTIVYKKVVAVNGSYAIAKLMIPKGTRCLMTEGKCRAAKAVVIDIRLTGKATKLTKARSLYSGHQFHYIPGEVVLPKPHFSNQSSTCDSGIHFFRTLREARNY
jgi:hypothetical protein